MTYATTITNQNQNVRWLLKIAGVDKYFATWGNPDGTDTYDDSDSHGELTILPNIVSVSVSGGRLQPDRHMVTDTTVTFTLADSATLRTVFGRRAAGQYLDSNLTLSGTTVVVGDNSSYSADDYIHIGQECIQVGSVGTGGNLDGCTRSALGTEQKPHAAGLSSEVTTQPQHWKGRKVELVLGTSAEGTWQYQDPYKTLYIDSSPEFSNGTWTLRASISLQHFDRKFYTGFRDVPVEQVQVMAQTISGATRHIVRITVDDIRTIVDNGNSRMALWVDGERTTGVFPVTTIGTASQNFVQLYGASRNLIGDIGRRETLLAFLEENGYEDLMSGLPIVGGRMTVRPCWPFWYGYHDPSPAQCALTVMASDLGGSPASYNRLPGVAATENAPKLRAGAGLSLGEINETSWDEAGEGAASSLGFIVGAAHEESLLSFLTQDVAPMLGGYVYVDAAGQIAFKKYAATVAGASSDLTVTDDNSLGGDNGVDDESTRLGSVDVGADYDWRNKEFRTRHIAHWLDLDKLYGDEHPKLEVNSRFAAVSYESALTSFDAYHARWYAGSLRHTLVVPWTGHLLLPGDTVTYTNARLPNFSGGQGITAQLYEVTGVAPDLPRGQVRLEVMRRTTGKMISPVVQLSSQVSGSDTWTVTPLYTDEDITEEWAVNWRVKFISSTDGTVRSESGVDFAVIASLDLTSGVSQMEFTSPPGNIAASDWVVFDDWADIGAVTATNTTSTATMSDFAYIDAESNNPSGAAHRWA